MTNQHPGFPPSNVPSQPSFEGKPCHPIDRNQQCYNNTDSQSHPHPSYREQRTDQWSQMKPQTHKTETDEDVWERHHHYEPQDQSRVRVPAKLLILMRGLPGCGKSTRARELLSTGPSGVILSTDDYFLHEHGYRYELGRLRAAHEWNKHRAKDALNEGRSPVIIDNTNLQAWEMKPYVQMALERGYTVDFCEPQTSWKFDPSELERRNKHKVPREKIAQMMDRYSFPISVDVVMRSEEPPHVTQQQQQQQQQYRPPQTMRRKHDFH
uniref:NEDD4-binding protein 2-like 2 n=2 Tax=Gouania willdenowi TaxID=441366 RepID=A0A8C5G8A6_GOUWI